jgi:hypothetical protein
MPVASKGSPAQLRGFESVAFRTWLLTRGAGAPPKSIPEIVELYMGWCIFAMFIPNDPMIMLIVMPFTLWLTEIELAQDWTDLRVRVSGTGLSQVLVACRNTRGD